MAYSKFNSKRNWSGAGAELERSWSGAGAELERRWSRAEASKI